MGHEAWNHDVVVGILREAEALFRELRRLLKYLDRRVMGDAQIDFRIDELQLAGGLEGHFRQKIVGVVAVAVHAAEHEALAVVALLDADIEVGIAVEGEEEFLQQLERLVLRKCPVVKIMLQIGEHVLVKPADAVVVFAFAPQRVVEDAEELKSFMERRGAVFGNA